MKIGEVIYYKEYTITHPVKEDFITEIAHDRLKDAKTFIDFLLRRGLIKGVINGETNHRD